MNVPNSCCETTYSTLGHGYGIDWPVNIFDKLAVGRLVTGKYDGRALGPSLPLARIHSFITPSLTVISNTDQEEMLAYD